MPSLSRVPEILYPFVQLHLSVSGIRAYAHLVYSANRPVAPSLRLREDKRAGERGETAKTRLRTLHGQPTRAGGGTMPPVLPSLTAPMHSLAHTLRPRAAHQTHLVPALSTPLATATPSHSARPRTRISTSGLMC
ncbi:hypothetical protein WOLCODRAFT_154024 [Wolfiporia cocos MD-104 SS10]|uniref:Uncharacterized protein n=1 Tax=Wolfiporia cocos (strain MD-104) TaxID=742152 RepID=A0A2H3JP64_WOLCO|nr:hypothetical protein WOLCODRAFT_154024 [Wolfiporia cocos MD-104 SS10]